MKKYNFILGLAMGLVSPFLFGLLEDKLFLGTTLSLIILLVAVGLVQYFVGVHKPQFTVLYWVLFIIGFFISIYLLFSMGH